jgi:hypothetical protein
MEYDGFLLPYYRPRVLSSIDVFGVREVEVRLGDWQLRILPTRRFRRESRLLPSRVVLR